MLERATTLPELREIVSVADAARVYAKRALCTLEVVNHAQRIKLSAERKAGEVLAKIEKDKGGGNVRSGHQSRTATGEKLKDLGVTNGFRTVLNCGQDGGQEVYHLHMHVMGGPRPWLKG